MFCNRNGSYSWQESLILLQQIFHPQVHGNQPLEQIFRLGVCQRFVGLTKAASLLTKLRLPTFQSPQMLPRHEPELGMVVATVIVFVFKVCQQT